MNVATRTVLFAAGVAALASCSSTMTPADAGPPPPGTKTYWIAPNGSDTALKLVTTQPPPGQ